MLMMKCYANAEQIWGMNVKDQNKGLNLKIEDMSDLHASFLNSESVVIVYHLRYGSMHSNRARTAHHDTQIKY